MNEVEHMKLFMEPKSVAIIGAPRNTGDGSLNILENLVNYGFKGKLFPVNPKASEILGVKVYPSIGDVPEEIDLAVLFTPRSATLGMVEECIRKEVWAIVIVAQGFADADEEGRMLQDQIVRIAREGGARIVGPNTFGVANAFHNLSTAFVPWAMERRPIGLISQTGMFFSGTPRFVLMGKAVDLGNCCDIDFADAMEYFGSDPEIELIALHVEGIRNGRRFIEVASRVTKMKPVLALKAGNSQLAEKAVQSHTGSLVGRTEIYDTVFKQCGIIRVSDMDELEDLSKAFLHLPLMRGRRVGIATLSGGGGILVVDACEKYNLKLAQLSPGTLTRLEQLYPPWLSVRNPVDMALTSSTAEALGRTIEVVLEALLSDEQVDGVVFITGAIPGQAAFVYSETVSQIAARHSDKPIVSWFYGPDVNREVAKKYDDTGETVVYPTCERAVRTLARLAERYEFLEKQVT